MPGRAALPPLDSLIEDLELLLAQARAYELALPANNIPARAAVARLAELARSALNEANTLAEDTLPMPHAGHPFTPRELQVLALVPHGLTNKEIAYRLGISERTIQYHLNAIFNKTATGSRAEAAALAISRGWIRIDKE